VVVWRQRVADRQDAARPQALAERPGQRLRAALAEVVEEADAVDQILRLDADRLRIADELLKREVEALRRRAAPARSYPADDVVVGDAQRPLLLIDQRPVDVAQRRLTGLKGEFGEGVG
jgi:hypothetical protein